MDTQKKFQRPTRRPRVDPDTQVIPTGNELTDLTARFEFRAQAFLMAVADLTKKYGVGIFADFDSHGETPQIHVDDMDMHITDVVTYIHYTEDATTFYDVQMRQETADQHADGVMEASCTSVDQYHDYLFAKYSRNAA